MDYSSVIRCHSFFPASLLHLVENRNKLSVSKASLVRLENATVGNQDRCSIGDGRPGRHATIVHFGSTVEHL